MYKLSKMMWAVSMVVMCGSVYANDLVKLGDGNTYVRTDRYTLSRTDIKEEQLSPLQTIVTMAFGANVRTVGDGVRELLVGSGYRWIVSSKSESQVLEALELPVINREIGPVKLRDALITLVGQAWVLDVNELDRTIRFHPAKNQKG